MKIEILIINPDNITVNEDSIRRVINSVTPQLFTIKSCQIEILIQSKKDISNLNQKYLDRSGWTDVISFPQVINQSDPICLLGTIAICPEYLAHYTENMEEVLIHGLIHLAGFDHLTDQKLWDKTLNSINYELH